MSNLFQLVISRKGRTDEVIMLFRGEESARKAYSAAVSAISTHESFSLSDDFGASLTMNDGVIESVLVRSVNGQHEGWKQLQLSETRTKVQLQKDMTNDPMLRPQDRLPVSPPQRPALVAADGQKM